MNRRDLLTSAAVTGWALAVPAMIAPQAAQAQDGAVGFGFDDVAAQAKDLATRPYQAPDAPLKPPFADLDYDHYRAIRFNRSRDPWAGLGAFGLDLLPPGLFYTDPVDISIVKDGVAEPIAFSPAYFDFDPAQFPEGVPAGEAQGMGWSGFRLRAPINRPDVMDEVVVFQGASYFRAVGRGTLYGLSARGLAIGTGQARGEEFPRFRAFWIHTPAPGDGSVVVQALLDSKSVTGAYEFIITPGAPTVIETRLSLFPRTDLSDVGIAPLTSMFWFGPANRAKVDDYRGAVHDSDGLSMVTGSGRRLWRPLSNPATLQFSNFMDQNPRGFGLMQRHRGFDYYADMEARYDRRPSAWITPAGGWGKGSVTLIEIPVRDEFNDNIVSFWKPSGVLAAGQRHDFAYRLTFGTAGEDDTPLAQVADTRSGAAINTPRERSFVIDFAGPFLGDEPGVPVVDASAGKISGVAMIPLEPGRVRLSFHFNPEGARLAELTARLDGTDGPLSETWVYRWTEG